jgi:hypothetical protein
MINNFNAIAAKMSKKKKKKPRKMSNSKIVLRLGGVTHAKIIK